MRTSLNTGHALVAERAMLTLKRLITKYCTHNKTRTFIPALQSIVDGYNSRYHRSIKMSPIDCENSILNQAKVRTINEKRYKLIWQKVSKQPPRFEEGQLVRIARLKSSFGRGFDQQSPEEIFTIHNIDQRKPVIYYVLKSLLDKEVLQGNFIEQELTEVRFSHKSLINDGGEVLSDPLSTGKVLVKVKLGDKAEQVSLLASDVV